MTHTRQMADHEGDFEKWQDAQQTCPTLVMSEFDSMKSIQCGAKVQVRKWESSDGGYEDYQYRCTEGHTWWIDGIDS